jgi:hypothetical protein
LVAILEPGDTVVSDKGFTIWDLLALAQCRLIAPTIRAQNQKTYTVRESKYITKVSTLRMHVERAMARIKSWRWLKKCIPLAQTDLVSDVFFVAAMLGNLKPALTATKSKSKELLHEFA